MTSDGPFAEVKEHLAGFYLVDCDSEERRRRDRGAGAGRACGGLVEVRPVLDMSSVDM